MIEYKNNHMFELFFLDFHSSYATEKISVENNL